MSRVGRCALWAAAITLALGCAERQVYWTRGDASEDQFRKVSRVCNEKAQIQVYEESLQASGQRQGCTVTTAGGGCGRSRSDAQLPFPEEAAKRRSERRRRYLYGQCLEARGWVRNYEGRGYEGR